MTYRAVVTGTESVSVVEIASLIEEWVSEGGSIIVQSTRLGLTSSCPVVIADRDSSECPEDITNSTLSTPPPPSTSTSGAVAGGWSAGHSAAHCCDYSCGTPSKSTEVRIQGYK